MTTRFVEYQGKIVHVRKAVTQEKLDSLVLDAKRILALVPAKARDGFDKVPFYLEAPEMDGSAWEYATRILALEWPVVEIWIGYPLIVSESQLQNI